MRRRLKQTRCTLDEASLPSTEGMELNYRLVSASAGEDRLSTVRLLALLTVIAWPLVCLLRVLGNLPIDPVVIFVGIWVGFFLCVCLYRFLREQAVSGPLGWACGLALCGLIIAVLRLTGSPEEAYLLFFPALAVTALFSHVLAAQYARFMCVNHRLTVEVTRTWQGHWRCLFRLGTPRGCPEARHYRKGYLNLLAAYALGHVVLLSEAVDVSPFEHLLGLLTFWVALHVLWLLTPTSAHGVPVFRAYAMTWRALVNWCCYNREQTSAAGTFQYDPPLCFPPSRRYVLSAVFVCLALAFVATSVPAVPATFWPSWTKKEAVQEAQFHLKTYEKLYLDRLPPEERTDYRIRLDARRRREVEEEPRQVRVALMDQFIAGLMVSCAATLFVPLLLFGVVACTTGRILAVYYDALEAPDALWASRERTMMENLSDRLRRSGNALEREHLLIGFTVEGNFPLLYHKRLLTRHAHLVGDPGTGKTAALMCYVAQLIATANASILILDLKGDLALFHTAREEAAKAGLPFRWFTNVLGNSSHVFNPFAQSHWQCLTLNQQVQLITMALGVIYGPGYGRTHFSNRNLRVCRTSMFHYRQLAALRELHDYLSDPVAYKRVGRIQDWEDAADLVANVERLAGVGPINPQWEDVTGTAVLADQIDIPSLLRTPQVVYFHLASVLEPITVDMIGRLALFTLLSAAPFRGPRETTPVYTVIDEFQRVLGEGIENTLDQARGFDIAFILANQFHQQLRRGGLDLTGSVRASTAFKQVFNVADREALRDLQLFGGEGRFEESSWTQDLSPFHDAEADDAFNIEAARGRLIPWFPPEGLLFREVRVGETAGDVLERNTAIELSARADTSFFCCKQSSGYTQFGGYVTPIFSDYYLTAAEYERRQKAPWPELTDSTVIVRDLDEEEPADTPSGDSIGQDASDPARPPDGGETLAERLRRAAQENDQV